ncbi:hypothetical protein E2C01_090682 [Portunus trituberculatus]|uniref:Uncharacterized protein n=1 Tax=Portunus trituberculatus TaxID=210409 RepID=A0A5B7JR14_PORTR|nr:hypothetical protein [Portunus trituberculatus]
MNITIPITIKGQKRLVRPVLNLLPESISGAGGRWQVLCFRRPALPHSCRAFFLPVLRSLPCYTNVTLNKRHVIIIMACDLNHRATGRGMKEEEQEEEEEEVARF